MQPVDRKALWRHRGTQNIAMRVDELLIARLADRLAIVDRGELRIAAQGGRHIARERRVRSWIAAFDTNQNQPRHQPVAQLIDQHALSGAR